MTTIFKDEYARQIDKITADWEAIAHKVSRLDQTSSMDDFVGEGPWQNRLRLQRRDEKLGNEKSLIGRYVKAYSTYIQYMHNNMLIEDAEKELDATVRTIETNFTTYLTRRRDLVRFYENCYETSSWPQYSSKLPPYKEKKAYDTVSIALNKFEQLLEAIGRSLNTVVDASDDTELELSRDVSRTTIPPVGNATASDTVEHTTGVATHLTVSPTQPVELLDSDSTDDRVSRIVQALQKRDVVCEESKDALPHQILVTELIKLGRTRLLVAYKTGTGKTRIMLDVINNRVFRHNRNTLVLLPTREIRNNFYNNIMTYRPNVEHPTIQSVMEHNNVDRIPIVKRNWRGTYDPDRFNSLFAIHHGKDHSKIVVMTFDEFKVAIETDRPDQYFLARTLCTDHGEIDLHHWSVVIDEAHILTHHSSYRSIDDYFKRRVFTKECYLFTATPLPKAHVSDLQTQTVENQLINVYGHFFVHTMLKDFYDRLKGRNLRKYIVFYDGDTRLFNREEYNEPTRVELEGSLASRTKSALHFIVLLYQQHTLREPIYRHHLERKLINEEEFNTLLGMNGGSIIDDITHPDTRQRFLPLCSTMLNKYFEIKSEITNTNKLVIFADHQTDIHWMCKLLEMYCQENFLVFDPPTFTGYATLYSHYTKQRDGTFTTALKEPSQTLRHFRDTQSDYNILLFNAYNPAGVELYHVKHIFCGVTFNDVGHMIQLMGRFNRMCHRNSDQSQTIDIFFASDRVQQIYDEFRRHVQLQHAIRDLSTSMTTSSDTVRQFGTD